MSDELNGRVSLVTGGSGGLGADIARELASRGSDVILVARSEDALRENAAELQSKHEVTADVIPMDLARREAPEELTEAVDDLGRQVDILVNNAGFGIFGEFLETDWDDQRGLLELDICTPVHLSHIFARRMIERGWGRLMQVASIGAYQPAPTYATYSAAKAFLWSWGEAFAYELEETGVSNTVVCPGVTETGFFERAGQNKTLFQKTAMMDSPTVAGIGVRAMLKEKLNVIPGLLNAVTFRFSQLLPDRLRLWAAYQSMKNE